MQHKEMKVASAESELHEELCTSPSVDQRTEQVDRRGSVVERRAEPLQLKVQSRLAAPNLHLRGQYSLVLSLLLIRRLALDWRSAP